MYLDFDDYRPDIQPIGRAISWREGILLSIIAHLMAVIVLLLAPRYFPTHARAVPIPLEALNRQPTRFVFVQPRVDRRAPRPPEHGEASDQDRLTRSPERRPTNPLPFSRGNTPERVESVPDTSRGAKPEPEKPQEDRQADADGRAGTPAPVPENQSALRLPAETGTGGRTKSSGIGTGDALHDAILRETRRAAREMFDNPGGGSQQMGGLQFDTKGVEFGPWVRRFIAQVKRNWIIPNSAMFNSRGHVAITFNVHKDGLLTDITVIRPCPIDSFNTAALGALKGSNPTEPLPAEYPTESAFFTLTFYYNEEPPRSNE
jgi:TonB family protein